MWNFYTTLGNTSEFTTAGLCEKQVKSANQTPPPSEDSEGGCCLQDLDSITDLLPLGSVDYGGLFGGAGGGSGAAVAAAAAAAAAGWKASSASTSSSASSPSAASSSSSAEASGASSSSGGSPTQAQVYIY